jgi:nitroimidazol reductase NimA-like FMN-containing flavoprotein (pyridoxamine 5'-phosphate oxidase superfamily)
MDAALKAKILQLLDAHRIMSLATLRPDGWPQATTVGFLNEGLTLYFMCGRDSQKARNLAADDRVSLTIDKDTPDPMAITGLSMAARATALTDPDEIRAKLFDLLPTKYPEYKAMMGGLDLAGVLVFKVEPWIVSVLDYSKGFGHTDTVALDAVA